MGGNCLSTTRNDMNAPVVIPATSKHTATVIFMHGLGDTGHGWAPVFQSIRSPHIKYICPTAPTIPVTLNMGMQMPSWFDIKGLNINADEDEQGIKKAAAAVHSWLEDEIKSGIPSERILLGGFSQGGGLALYSTLTFDKALAGVIGLSCWMPLHKQVPGNHEVNRNIPILQCHGDADPLVIVQVGQLTAKMLQTFNTKHSLKIYPGMGHSSCDQEIKDIKAFIEQHLPSK